MSNFLYALPSIVLVGFANAILKWRSSFLSNSGIEMFSSKPLQFIFDPYIFLGAFATLCSVLWWLKIVPLVPVSVVYPMIQGGAIVFTLLLASWLLSEHLHLRQLAGIGLVIAGIVLLSSYAGK